jgi:hypothetical protein
MGINGRNVDTFADGNFAYCDEMHLDSNYPHKMFSIVKTDGRVVTLRSHGDGTEMTLKIRRERNGQREYAVIYQSSSYEILFRRRPARFVIYAMKGE